jgi:hypothetical protein
VTDSNSEITQKFHEKRKAIRFVGQLPIELKQGTGLTRNLSTSGVYFVTDQSLSNLEPIEFFLVLEHTGLGPQVRVHCCGEVVRVEPGGERTGVAVAVHSYSIEKD